MTRARREHMKRAGAYGNVVAHFHIAKPQRAWHDAHTLVRIGALQQVATLLRNRWQHSAGIRRQRSALLKTMFLAFHAAGAKDWQSNLATALDHRGARHRLQFHHVFPKAVLKGSYTAAALWPFMSSCRSAAA